MKVKTGRNLLVMFLLTASLVVFVVQNRTLQRVKSDLQDLRRHHEARTDQSSQEQLLINEVSSLSNEQKTRPVVNEMPTASNEQKIVQREIPEGARVQSQNLPQEKEQLAARVKELEALANSLQQELAEIQSTIPEENEDGQLAYVGPGTWIASNPATRGVKTVVISPSLDPMTMTIHVWGACLPVDCDWGVVPLFLLDRMSHSATKIPFQRGFALWDNDPINKKYAIVTFETSGLRLEVINVRDRYLRSVDRLVKVN
jgi:hypothetical protein